VRPMDWNFARYAENDAQLQKLLCENCVITFREP
jgi:hypothetical protein